jgi:prepilin-type N-terminal cleavage/methylation domain-containing protein/prepilin-type processing-associated H-X9-DG protein
MKVTAVPVRQRTFDADHRRLHPRGLTPGFTLVELLVVIGIIAILVGILLPALTKAKRQAQIVQCAAGMHNIGGALFAYAADNAGWLPAAKCDGGWYAARNGSGAPTENWMWDMSAPMRDLLVKYGAIHQSFYCPSNAETQDDGNTAGSMGAGTSEWDYNAYYNYQPTMTNAAIPGRPADSAGFGVMGYVFLIQRLDPGLNNLQVSNNVGDAVSTTKTDYYWNFQNKISKAIATQNRFHVSRPTVAAQTELVVEAMVSNNLINATAAGRAQVSWGLVLGGWPKPEPSAHLYGQEPAGMNVLFMDGHVDWRTFTDCFPRTNVAPGNGRGGVYFWW